MSGVAMQESEARAELCRVYRSIESAGLSLGNAGNISIRWREHMLISPTGADGATVADEAPHDPESGALIHVASRKGQNAIILISGADEAIHLELDGLDVLALDRHLHLRLFATHPSSPPWRSLEPSP